MLCIISVVEEQEMHIRTQIQRQFARVVFISFFLIFEAAYACSDEVTGAVLEMAELIETNYILPDAAIRVANKLRANAKAGKYSIYRGSPKKLADAVSREIRDYSQDNHMYAEYVAEKDEQNNWVEEWLEQAPENNFGIRKVEILEGNIGYLSISSFYPLEISKSSIQAAMELLKHTQGMILDLRNNGGGDETSANAILATFLPPGQKPPLLIESRGQQKSMPVLGELDWPRYSERKKLVILINNRTFSAPESLAFSLQEIGRALVVGSSSAGGAHMTDRPLKVCDGYELGIPNKRPVSRFTGKNWEGTGVIPNIESNDLKAIKVALKKLTVKQNAATTSP